MSAPPLGELAEPVHLGVLARCHAVAVPELRAGNAVQALRDHFGVECSEGVVAVIYDKLLREAPHVLGGAPLPLHGLLGEATLIRPACTHCVDCGVCLDMQAALSAQAFLLHVLDSPSALLLSLFNHRLNLP